MDRGRGYGVQRRFRNVAHVCGIGTDKEHVNQPKLGVYGFREGT